MAELGDIELWRLKHKIEFGEYGTKELPNYRTINTFVPKFTLHAADYRLSLRDIQNPNGVDVQSTKVVAVRHKPNRNYDSFLARYKGEIFNITLVVPDESKLRTFDLISLKKVDKNG